MSKSVSSPMRTMESVPAFVSRLSTVVSCAGSAGLSCAKTCGAHTKRIARAQSGRRRAHASRAACRALRSFRRLSVVAAIIITSYVVWVEGAVGPAPARELHLSPPDEHGHDREREENYQKIHQARHPLLDAHGELWRRRLVPVLPLRFEPHRVPALGERRQVDRLLA